MPNQAEIRVALAGFGADGFGPVLARMEPGGSGWLDPLLYSRRPFASGTRLTSLGLHSGNSFVRRAWYRRRGFDPALGMTGSEDTELFRWMVERSAHPAHFVVSPFRSRFEVLRTKLGWGSK